MQLKYFFFFLKSLNPAFNHCYGRGVEILDVVAVKAIDCIDCTVDHMVFQCI